MYKKLSNNNNDFQAYKRFVAFWQPGSFSCKDCELHYLWPPKQALPSPVLTEYVLAQW